MKIAVCLHGLARGSSVQADGAYLEKFSTLLEKIGESDVFIHSWDEDIKDELLELFKPIEYLIEPQKSLEEELDSFKDCEFSPQGMLYESTPIAQGHLFRTLSFLYSRKKAIELKGRHEEKNNFVYDVVLTSRFDVGHHKQGCNKTSHLNFDPSLDMTKIYQAYWDQTNAGSSDHWFYSNSKNIEMLSTIYEEVFNYLKKDSKYSELCREGWPLSNKGNEFSGELFKKERSTDLAKYIKGENVLINNHCLYKFHLMENQMWDDGQSVFLNKDLWDG